MLMLPSCAYERWRSGLSRSTVPVFFVVVPGGNIAFSSARFTTGPLTRNGSVGSRPADGPGSTLLVGKLTVKEGEMRPCATRLVKFEYAVFLWYLPQPPRI